MKSLKTTLMGMFVLFVWSFVFTSCAKQETILTESVEAAEFIMEKRSFALPIGHENQSEADLEVYFANLDDDGFNALETSYQVRAYLAVIGKLELVSGEMVEGQLFSDVDLSSYLTEREQVELSNFEAAVDNSRCEYRLYCVTSGWCSSNNPKLQVWRRCNGTYYGFCSPNCNVF